MTPFIDSQLGTYSHKPATRTETSRSVSISSHWNMINIALTAFLPGIAGERSGEETSVWGAGGNNNNGETNYSPHSQFIRLSVPSAFLDGLAMNPFHKTKQRRASQLRNSEGRPSIRNSKSWLGRSDSRMGGLFSTLSAPRTICLTLYPTSPTAVLLNTNLRVLPRHSLERKPERWAQTTVTSFETKARELS